MPRKSSGSVRQRAVRPMALLRRVSAMVGALALTFDLAAPVLAQSASYDLSSQSRTQTAPQLGGATVFIREGRNIVRVDGQTALTPAERVAVMQVLSGGTQSLRLGTYGNAISGSFGLGPNPMANISAMVIPKGVTSYNSSANVSVLGDLTNSGSLFVNVAQNALATISANNIINNVGALIKSSGALNLVAAKSIFNYGQIISSGNLGLTAGDSIVNTSSRYSGTGLVSAGSDLNLVANNIVNSGMLSAALGNINISSLLAHDIVINNKGGTISAAAGDINVRDASFTGKYNFDITGGDLISKNVNVWSGNGTADINVRNVNGVVNVTASSIHVLADTPNLRLGNMLFTDDPTFFNTGGSIEIDSTIGPGGAAPSPGVAIIAQGDVTALPSGQISTLSGTANGFPLLIIAGANFTVSPSTAAGTANTSTQNGGNGDSISTITLLGPSVTGGKIDLHQLNGNTGNFSTAGQSSGGGSLTLVAYAGTGTATGSGPSAPGGPSAGTVTIGNITTNSGNSAANGNVTIIAGAKSDPSGSSAITTGTITTDTQGSPGGSVVLLTGTPVITGGGQFQIQDGTVLGPNIGLASASLGASNVNPGASISVGAINTNTSPVVLVAGNNVTLNGNITTKGVAQQGGVGPGGNVLVFAGGNISGNATSISTKGSVGDNSSTYSNAGGEVVLAAGVKTTASLTHTFIGSVAGLPANTTDTVAANVSVVGASANGGNISLANLANINTSAGATQFYAPTTNNANGGDVTVVAFAGANSAATTGQINLPAVQIASGGSPLASITGAATTIGSTTVTVTSITGLAQGMAVTGPGIPAGTTIASPPSGNTITLSNSATVTGSNQTLFIGTQQAATNNVNGNVTVIAGGQPTAATASSIVLGSASTANATIDTSGGNEGAGNITVVTAQPDAGLPYNYVFNSSATTGAVKSGSFAPSKTLAENITINNKLNAVGGSYQILGNQTATTTITVNAGGDLNIAAVNNTNNTLPVGGPPGALSSSIINLIAGGTMAVGGAITSNAGSVIPSIAGADGGTINLTAASFTFPNGPQTISANGTGGYVLLSSPLNFTGTLSPSSNTITNAFTVIDGTGLVVGSVITDNAGGTLIPVGTTIANITPGTIANATLLASSPVVNDIITVGLSAGLAVTGGSIPAGSTIGSVSAPSVTFNGNTSSSTNTITNVTNLTGTLVPGQIIAGPGIPVGAKVSNYDSGTQILTFTGGNSTRTGTGGSFAQAGQLTLANGSGFASVVPGPIQLAAANGTITLSGNTTASASGVQPLTNLLPVGQSGGNGGTISIKTTSASPINVSNTAFTISAVGDTAGGNGGQVNLNSGSSIAITPANLTAGPSQNNLANSGFGTIINTGTGAIFNFTAATTVLISGSLNADGATSTLSGATGTPNGNGGVINIIVNSTTPFNVGAATTNGLTSGVLSANGNNGTVSGFGSGGTISITNRGGDIQIGAGALSVVPANATDLSNTGVVGLTYTGGAGGNIVLKGQNVISLGSLDASGGATSAIRGSGDGGSIRIETNSANTFVVGATSAPTNGVQGSLSAAGNRTGPTATQGTIIGTLPSGNGGSIILKNTKGGISLLAGAGMSVAAANASTKLGNLGGDGGDIELYSNTTIQSAIGLFADGGLQASGSFPTPTSPSTVINNGNNVVIPVGSTNGLFVGQTITVTNSTDQTAESVLIQSVDSQNNEITVWSVVAAPAGGYVNPTLQTYFAGGNGGTIVVAANASGTTSASQMTINAGTTSASYINGAVSAHGYNGGVISITNRGTGGLYVAPNSVSTAPRTLPTGVGSTLVGVGGFGGNLALQAPLGPVAIDGTQNSAALDVSGVTTTVNQQVGPNFGGIGGNLTIVSNSAKQFNVNSAGPATAAGFNGVVGTLAANGGAGIGGNSAAGTVTIINLGTGGILVGTNTTTSNSAISIVPGLKSDGSTIGSVGPPGNGGSLTLTAPKGPVFVAGTNGIDMSGNTQHASNEADGLGGSVSITSNGGATAFNIGAGTTNGTAGPIIANGWSGGSITIISLGTGGISLNNTGGSTLEVTANAANNNATGSGGIHLNGGPGGFITLEAPKGPVAITGGIDASGGGQTTDGSSYFLQGGNGGQIAILSGVATPFNIGGATAGSNGSTGALSANGANGGVVSVTTLNGGDIYVSTAASISVNGFPGGFCSQCNDNIPLGNPPTDISLPGGNGGRIYLQATGTTANVFISGNATTGGLSVAGAPAQAPGGLLPMGPNSGNGGIISIITNSATTFNLGGAASNTNGVGSGGAGLNASGYNGGSIGIKNGTGSLYFNPSLISVSSAGGSVATTSDFPGGNGGIIDLQAPKGKLGANVAGGILSADATASTDPSSPQTTASGGTILLSAMQIDQTTGFAISAKGAQPTSYQATGIGGTVIIKQTTTTAAQALQVGGASSKLSIVVNGSPGAALGGTIMLSSPAGLNFTGNVATDTSVDGNVIISTGTGTGTLTQAPTAILRTGALSLQLGTGGTGAAGLSTSINTVNINSSGAVQLSNLGYLTINSAYMTKSAALTVSTAQGDLTVNSISSNGAVTLSASGIDNLLNSTGNVIINGNLIASTANITAMSGNGILGGGIYGPGLVSANSIVLNPEIGGVLLNTATGFLTVNTSGAFLVEVNNTGNLLLSMGTSSAIGALIVNNVGSITTTGPMTMIGSVTLDNVPGTVLSGSLVAGSNIFNTSQLNSLILGMPVQGIGLPAGTTVGAIGSAVAFSGTTDGSSNVINSVVAGGSSFGALVPGAAVNSPALNPGTVITSAVQQFSLGLAGAAYDSSTSTGYPLINNVPSANLNNLVPGVLVNATDGSLPAGTTVVSTTNQLSFTGNTGNGTNTITNVPVAATTTGLVVGVALINVAGIPAGAIVTNISAPSGGFVTVTFSGTSTTTANTNVPVTVPNYVTVSNTATASSTQAILIPNFVVVNSAPVSAGSASFNQAAYAALSQPAGVTIANASVKQLNTLISGNSNSITLGGTVGSGATNPQAVVNINAGGSIIQTAGVISGNAINLTSLNGNIGMLTRTFTNHIYTPGGTPLNLDIVPNASVPGTLTIITANAIDNSSAGTVNVSVGATTANPSGSFTVQSVQAGGDVLIASNLATDSSVLNVAGTVTSAYGAITVLNSNQSSGVLSISANMAAAGGPLTIQNNNSGVSAPSSILINSSSTTPLTLSGVGWYVDGVVPANVANSNAGVAILTGAFASPQVGTNPGNITVNAGPGVVYFGTSGNVSSDTPNTVINATGASVVFNGANGAILLGNSGTINATSSALVISSLDLSNATVKANLTALQTAPNSGVTGSLATGTIAFDPTQASMPLSLSNLSALNVPSTVTVTFANFGASNPVAVNVASGANATVPGKINFQAVTGTAANNFNTDGHLFINSAVVGQTLTVAGKITSDNNLMINVGGSVTISGALTGGTNGTLGLFTGAANPAFTAATATTLPAGTISLTGGDLAAGQSNNSGNIILSAVNFANSSTASLTASNVSISMGGTNWVPGTSAPVNIAASKLTAIPVISAGVLSLNAGSGGSISLAGATGSRIGTLSMDVMNTPVTISQFNSLTLSGQSNGFVATPQAASTILNGNTVSALVVGTLVQGIGIPAGTRVASLSQAVSFTGDTGANANVITNVPDSTAGLTVGAAITGDGIPAGAVITAVSAPAGGFVQVSFSGVSSVPAATGSNFGQSVYATLTNAATASISNVTLQNFASPTTLNTLKVTVSGGASGITTASDISCSSCSFTSERLTNLNIISTNSPAGTVTIKPPTGFTLTITQTDGVNSGSILANAGISISAGQLTNIIGGAMTTNSGTLSILQTGGFPLTISSASLTAGTFNGVPLGPNVLPTDVASTGKISITAGAGGLVVSDSAQFHSIGSDLNVKSDGATSIQGNFLADGGNLVILSKGALTATGSFFGANAFGVAAADSLGGNIEVAAGTTTSKLSTASLVPGSLPYYPLFIQPSGGPAQPLGTSVAINNNAAGVFYPTGSITQNLSGTNPTMNLGNSNTAQTGFNLLGGSMVFTSNSSSLLIDDSIFSTNGFSPIAAVSGKEGMEVEVDDQDADLTDAQALARVFAHGRQQEMILTTQGFVKPDEMTNVKSASKPLEFTVRRGELFLETLAPTTIHTDLADVVAKKGALLVVSSESAGVRIAVCSGPGHVTVTAGKKSISLSAGEELLVSSHQISDSDLLKADGVGRRKFASHQIAAGVHVGVCEVSLLSLMSSWDHLSGGSAKDGSAKLISERLLKTAAVLSVVTQSHGAYQARAKARSVDAPAYLPVNFTSKSRPRLSASAR